MIRQRHVKTMKQTKTPNLPPPPPPPGIVHPNKHILQIWGAFPMSFSTPLRQGTAIASVLGLYDGFWRLACLALAFMRISGLSVRSCRAISRSSFVFTVLLAHCYHPRIRGPQRAFSERGVLFRRRGWPGAWRPHFTESFQSNPKI